MPSTANLQSQAVLRGCQLPAVFRVPWVFGSGDRSWLAEGHISTRVHLRNHAERRRTSVWAAMPSLSSSISGLPSQLHGQLYRAIKGAAGVIQPLSTDKMLNHGKGTTNHCAFLSLHLKCQQTPDLPRDSVSTGTQTCIYKHLSEGGPEHCRSEKSPGRLRVDSPSLWAVHLE